MKKRFEALEAEVAQDGIILIESQLAALEKAKSEKEAQRRVIADEYQSLRSLPGRKRSRCRYAHLR